MVTGRPCIVAAAGKQLAGPCGRPPRAVRRDAAQLARGGRLRFHGAHALAQASLRAGAASSSSAGWLALGARASHGGVGHSSLRGEPALRRSSHHDHGANRVLLYLFKLS
eukprot:scaffold2334_cov357-Prasinococcus_capsulatus_cf.AAC.4